MGMNEREGGLQERKKQNISSCSTSYERERMREGRKKVLSREERKRTAEREGEREEGERENAWVSLWLRNEWREAKKKGTKIRATEKSQSYTNSFHATFRVGEGEKNTFKRGREEKEETQRGKVGKNRNQTDSVLCLIF